MAELTRPARLRDLLDAGVNPTTLYGLQELVDLLVLMVPAVEDHEEADQLDSLVDKWLSGCLGAASSEHQGSLARFAWHAELLRDAALRDRIEAALPARYQAELAQHREEMRHPHRLVVRAVEGDEDCTACGERISTTVIDVDDSDGRFCVPCVSLAVDVASVDAGAS